MSILAKSQGIFGCLILACLAGSAAAQAPDRTQSVPFELQDNLVRVPVSINGHRATGVLDSGTGAVVLDRTFALSMGMKPGATIGDAPGGGGPSAMYPVSVGDVRFGPEDLTGVQGTAIDLSHTSQSAGFAVNVLLGLPVFKDQPIQIDYPKKRIVFLPAEQRISCADPISFTMAGGSPAVDADVQVTLSGPTQTLHLIVDMGTRYSLAMVGGPFLSSPEGKMLVAQSAPQQIGTGGEMQGHLVEVNSVKIGTQTWNHPTIALTSDLKLANLGLADGTLGVPLWIDRAITFDYPHKILCLGPPINADKH